MKKYFGFIAVALAACISFCTGCKTAPTVETMYKYSYTVGKAAGYVIQKSKMSDSDKTKLLEVINKLKEVTPQTNETFEVAWERAAKVEVAKYVAEKKIDELIGQLIIKASAAAGKGIDLVIKKNPKVAGNAELVKSAVNGVIDGINSVIVPTIKAPAGSYPSIDVDKEVDLEAYFILNESTR